jgi:hypothetical protein
MKLTQEKLIDSTFEPAPARSLPINSAVDLQLAADCKTLLDRNALVAGTVSDRTSNILRTLHTEKEVILQCFAKKVALADSGVRQTSKRSAGRALYQLFTIIYGPLRLSKSIGNFAYKCKVHLQDPLHCDREVPLINAHRLPRRDGRVWYTTSTSGTEVVVNLKGASENPLDFLESIDDLEALQETEPHPVIRRSLMR